jgi:hypothetical protein
MVHPSLTSVAADDPHLLVIAPVFILYLCPPSSDVTPICSSEQQLGRVVVISSGWIRGFCQSLHPNGFVRIFRETKLDTLKERKERRRRKEIKKKERQDGRKQIPK